MSKLLQESTRFSLYKNLYTEKPDLDIDITELYEIIKFGFLRKEIKELRKSNDTETRKDMKKSILPAVTLSGKFDERSETGLLKHSGLLQIDFDASDSYDELFKKVTSDKYTFMAFRSSEGTGIKVIVKIKASKETHERQFFALQDYYKNHFDIALKTSFKQISRAMVLSFDPDIYRNLNASIFNEIGTIKEEEPAVDNVRLEKNKALNPTLYKRLQKMRLVFSRKQEIPAYMVFHNKVLSQLVRKTPKTKEELLQINGFGKHRVNEYGESILKTIKQ
jgi:superfamily II DNA helicase RecQ